MEGLDKVTREMFDNLVNYCIATEDEITLVCQINGYSEQTMLDILYVKTGMRSWEQYLREYGYDEEE